MFTVTIVRNTGETGDIYTLIHFIHISLTECYYVMLQLSHIVLQIAADVSLPQFKVMGHRQKTIEASLSTGEKLV